MLLVLRCTIYWFFLSFSFFLPSRPKEFIDCIAHVRLLSWLLLGSLTHAAVCPINSSLTGIICHPIPLEAGNHIADHVQVGTHYTINHWKRS